MFNNSKCEKFLLKTFKTLHNATQAEHYIRDFQRETEGFPACSLLSEIKIRKTTQINSATNKEKVLIIQQKGRERIKKEQKF